MASTILLADSGMGARNMGQKILAAAGYEVTTVNNGVDAIKKIAELHPDIVLLDVYMAGYTGIEVCQMMKGTSGMKQIPVLLTAGSLDPFRASEAEQLRADGVVIKPFGVSNLIAVVGKLAEHLRPSEPAPATRLAVQETGHSADRAWMGTTIKSISRESSPDAARGPDKKASETQVVGTAVRSQPIPESPRVVHLPAPVSRDNPSNPVSSNYQNGEVCDVCGHLNRGDVSVCQQCDVPLPSSVTPSGVIASHP